MSRENPFVKAERSDRIQPGKIVKMIEHFGYSIRYCKPYCLYIKEGAAVQIVTSLLAQQVTLVLLSKIKRIFNHLQSRTASNSVRYATFHGIPTRKKARVT